MMKSQQTATGTPRDHPIARRIPSMIPFSSLFPVVRASSASEQRLNHWIEQYQKFSGCNPDAQTPGERLWLTLSSIKSLDGWEWDAVWFTVHGGLVGGAVLGMLVKSQDNKLAVIRQYSEVQFDHPFLAQRKMRDQHYLRNIKNGFKVGWRVALFSSILTTATLSSLSYRNYVNPLDIAALAGVTGGIWKWQMGPKGMLSAAGLAGTFGLFAGCMIWSIFKITGHSVAEFRLRMGGEYMMKKMADKQDLVKETTWIGHKQTRDFLSEREMMLQQRRMQERMKEHEAELAAKQKELADDSKTTSNTASQK